MWNVDGESFEKHTTCIISKKGIGNSEVNIIFNMSEHSKKPSRTAAGLPHSVSVLLLNVLDI